MRTVSAVCDKSSFKKVVTVPNESTATDAIFMLTSKTHSHTQRQLTCEGVNSPGRILLLALQCSAHCLQEEMDDVCKGDYEERCKKHLAMTHVSLSAPGLTVGKAGCHAAFKDTIHQRLGGVSTITDQKHPEAFTMDTKGKRPTKVRKEQQPAMARGQDIIIPDINGF